MKPIKYYVGISALALMSMAPMYAQMNSLQVNVPFAFTVGSEKMPAGAYMVQTSESGLVMLQGSGHAVTFLSTPFETRGRPAHPAWYLNAAVDRCRWFVSRTTRRAHPGY